MIVFLHASFFVCLCASLSMCVFVRACLHVYTVIYISVRVPGCVCVDDVVVCVSECDCECV